VRGKLPTYRTWARSLLSPRARLLPGVGARLGAHPWLAARLLEALHRLPGRRLRNLAYRNVTVPLALRLRARLELRVGGGFRMRVDTSDVMARALATGGTWEPYVVAELRRLLAPGDVCVDVGANLGYYTLLASRLVGPAGHVYALEPAEETFDELRRNLDLNGVSNVTALRVAAGAAEGTAPLYRPSFDNTGAASLRESVLAWAGPTEGPTTDVPVRPLHALIDAAHLGRLSVVKIDVEGAEADTLRGLEPLLEQGLRPTLIVEVHSAYDPGAPASVADLCKRHRLQASWLFDDDRVDLSSAPADRALVARELRSLGELLALPRDRFVVVLTG
jgi:FkbM family methyltransferase